MPFRSLAPIAALVLGAVGPPAGAQALPAFASRIDARVMAVISDGDFRVSTYRDGKLSGADPERRDRLSIVRLGARPARVDIPVSNSVSSPPEVMTISPDGRFVYVVERLGPRGPGTASTRDLAPGRRLTAIDIRDPARPVVAGEVDVGPMPESVRVSPDGRFLAIAANSAQQALLQIVPTREGRLGPPRSFALETLGVARRDEAAPRGGIDASMVDWHPAGRHLAVNLNTRNQVLFLALRDGPDGEPVPAPWGAPVDVGRDPFVGRFTPDGKHYISADWGRDFAAKDLEGRLPKEASRLSLVRLAPREAAGAGAAHAVVATVATDRSSEGLAISRDGRHVATVNMRETALAPDSPRHTAQASISYFRFDAARSALVRVADYPFDGLLPEGGTFDASGRHFMATVFEYAGDGAPASGVEVWRVGDADRPGLSYLGRLPMPHGAHHVEVAR